MVDVDCVYAAVSTITSVLLGLGAVLGCIPACLTDRRTGKDEVKMAARLGELPGRDQEKHRERTETADGNLYF